MTNAQSKKIKELTNVLKAVRLRCLDCSAENPHEVKTAQFLSVRCMSGDLGV